MAFKDVYGFPQPDGFTYDELTLLIEIAQAAWSAEQIKLWGNDCTSAIGHDQVRHILLAAEQVRAMQTPAVPVQS